MAWTRSSFLKAAAVALGLALLQSPSSALTGTDYRCEDQEAGIANATAISILPSVCYSPFHNKEYPLLSSMTLGDLQAAMDEDFSIISRHFSSVRTYYSGYYGIPIAPIAAKYGVKLYLGVFMTTESWYTQMVSMAVDAVKNYPETVTAILVGNENIEVGPYSPAEVKQHIVDIRKAIMDATGRTNVPIGTVQRSTEWLEEGIQAGMQDLAAASDIIGVNIYPFFDKNFNANQPAQLLDGTWNAMLKLYGQAKLRVTETGWPTAGTAISTAPKNTPSLANAKLYYDAFTTWQPAAGGGEAFWFMFFDRAPYDTTMGIDIETFFGFFTWEKQSKMASGFPNLVNVASTLPATTAPITTAPAATTAAPASTPAPTTATPAPTTATPSPTTATPTTTTPAPTTATPAPTTATPTTTTPAPTTATPTPTTAAPAVTAATPSTSTPAPTTATPAPTTASPTPTTASPSASTPSPYTTPHLCNVRS